MSLQNRITWREYVVEFLLSFSLVFTSVFTLFSGLQLLAPVVVSIVFGVMYLIFRNKTVSFGHPLMSLVLIVLKKINISEGANVIAVQLFGGTLAGVVSIVSIVKYWERFAGLTKFATDSWSAALGEFFGAFILVAGIMSLIALHNGRVDDNKNIMNIMLIVFAGLMIAMLTGGIGLINPAAALATMTYMTWTYTLAPILGALFGALTYVILNEGISVSLNLHFKKNN